MILTSDQSFVDQPIRTHHDALYSVETKYGQTNLFCHQKKIDIIWSILCSFFIFALLMILFIRTRSHSWVRLGWVRPGIWVNLQQAVGQMVNIFTLMLMMTVTVMASVVIKGMDRQ